MPRLTGVLGVMSLTALVLLTGCREDEQNRALHFEKGTYAGKQDKGLTDEQRRELEQRATHQRFQ